MSLLRSDRSRGRADRAADRRERYPCSLKHPLSSAVELLVSLSGPGPADLVYRCRTEHVDDRSAKLPAASNRAREERAVPHFERCTFASSAFVSSASLECAADDVELPRDDRDHAVPSRVPAPAATTSDAVREASVQVITSSTMSRRLVMRRSPADAPLHHLRTFGSQVTHPASRFFRLRSAQTDRRLKPVSV